MDSIYLDASATTPLLPPVWEAMLPFQALLPGNPSSSHHYGRQARRALDDARQKLAHALDCQPDEILFTSGATEANNLAVFGLAGAAPGRLVVSPLEHPCVAGPVEVLQQRGAQVERLPADASGRVVLPAEAAPDGSRCRVGILMLANHETGVVQPVREFVDQAAPAPVHCDAAAAAGKMPISFRQLGAATLALSAHKFHGPKGIGALVVRKGVRLHPLLFGGHQQHGLRPGTEPVPLIVGMAAALELAMSNLDQATAHVRLLRDRFVAMLAALAPPVIVNGAAIHALPHVVNLSFPGCSADVLLMKLDLAGVACSTGSACSSGSLLPSPVLKAIGLAPDILTSAMRFSFMRTLRLDEVEEAARRIGAGVRALRSQ